jgi:mono/diheme cytochrome c family protein
MQVKIIIGTVAFMMTMMLFGYAALREPARLERFAAADLARNIEKGAEIFYGNCATCHGVAGDAVECFDAAGTQIACLGLPLRDSYLLCGEPSNRLIDQDYKFTVRDYIYGTIYAGRVGTQMPTWSADLGGPMQGYEIENVTRFILNWQGELCTGTPEPAYEWPITVTALLETEGITVPGDAANGQTLYETTYACTSCHGDPATEGSNRVGPWLGDLAERGSTIVEGYAAADYMYESLLNPNAHIAEECPTGPCNTPSGMPGNFSIRIRDPQSMIDLMTYVLGDTLETNGVEVNYAPR